MSTLQTALKQKRISCQFVGDYENYNHGESAVFNAPIAHMLKKRGVVEFNEHEVKNDTGLLQLIAGKNHGGMNESDVARVVESKIEGLEKRLEKVIAEQMKLLATHPESSLPRSSVRKS